MTRTRASRHAAPRGAGLLPLLTLLAVMAFGCDEGGYAMERVGDGERAARPPAAIRSSSRLPSSPRTADERLVDSAQTLIASGRAWQATMLLTPVLGDPKRASAALTLTAAAAAAGWGGWTQVEQLLRGAPWLDTLQGGEGHILLTRAALERPWSPGTVDSASLPHAERAVRAAPTAAERMRRTVLLARARERAGDLAAAADAYTRSAAAFPELRDWLALRAAALAPDSGGRLRAYAALRTAAARARAPWVEAQARATQGDAEGAARVYTALGAHADAWRVRLERGADNVSHPAARAALLALVRAGGGEGREAVTLLDRHFAPLAAAEQLTIARALTRIGPAARAATAFAAAARAGLLTAEDRFAYGTTLARAGRQREAAAQFALAAGHPPQAAEALYQRGRALLRAGSAPAASAALAAVIRDFPASPAAASALYLSGDLASDAGRDELARARFREIARRHPASPYAARARFRAAIIAFANRELRATAAELDTLAQLPRHDELSAALYWSGRAHAALGDAATAAQRWREVMASDPASYYSVLAARRLDIAPWRPPAAPDIAQLAEVERALERAAILEAQGMTPEARLEYEQLERAADSSLVQLVATADAFRRHGHASRGIRLAQRALARGATRDAAIFRVLYPLAYRDLILAEAGARGLDAGFVAALIRQESNFTPGATSGAGARGLMQVMPTVGRALARARGFPFWDTALLYQPDVSIQLGTAHLASQVRTYREPVRVLAAYNAGGSRVNRWRSKAGASDPELFVERIPYVETRDYVRIVLRNREVYRALWGL